MINLGVVMPMGRTIMYIPNDNDGPVNDLDFKAILAFGIVMFIITLIGIVIELIRGRSLKEILLLDWRLSAFTAMTMISAYSIFGIAIIVYLCHLIYSIL